MLCTSSRSKREKKLPLEEKEVALPEIPEKMEKPEKSEKPDMELGEEADESPSEKKTFSFEIQNADDAEEDTLSDYVDRLALAEGASSSCEEDEDPDYELSEDLLVQFMKQADGKRLKQELRGASWGVKHGVRKSLWRHMCKHLHKADEHDEYTEIAAELFPTGDALDSSIRIPSFVDTDNANNYYLTTEGILNVKKLLCVLEHYKPDIVHCPLLYSVVSLFMHYKTPSDSFNSVYALLRSKESAFITQTKVAYEASKLVVRDLAKKYAKSGYVHLVRQCSNVDSVFEPWIWWIFQDLPFPYLLRIMDCYLHEGMKVLYRVALAIVILYGKHYAKKQTPSPKHEKSSATVVQNIRTFCREIPVKVDKLLKTGFNIRGLTRKEIRKLQVKHEMYINSMRHMNNGDVAVGNGTKMTMSKSFSGPIILQSTGSNMLCLDKLGLEDRIRSLSVTQLHGHLQFDPEESAIFDKMGLFTIWTWLPTRYAVCQPVLLYTSEEHGTSLVTLYQMIENHQPTVIVIKTTNDEIFGAFCSSFWMERRKEKGLHLSYFGTGETFVFTLSPEKKKYAWVGLTEDNIPNTAHMFQAGDRTILTIGGGHGEAIYLDESLLHCRTERCDTFNNEPLCSTEDFICKVVEVYGFE